MTDITICNGVGQLPDTQSILQRYEVYAMDS